jgi:HK97 family phage prohead protease
MKPKPKVRLREQRIFDVDLEIREAEGDQPRTIVGHPVVYNRWSEDLGGFRERVLPGAATKTIAESDIRALFNHDPNFILGRNRAGTLRLIDEPGKLRMELTPPETDTINDLVIAPMRRRDLTQMSFGFRTIKDEWRDPSQATKKDGLWERDLIEFSLFDVSPVTFPAYPQTDVHVRALLGELEGTGVDFGALTAMLTRAERGIPTTDADIDLVIGSIAALRSYLPAEPEPELLERLSVSIAARGHHSDAEPEPDAGHHSGEITGRSVVQLRRLLDLEAAALSPVPTA